MKTRLSCNLDTGRAKARAPDPRTGPHKRKAVLSGNRTKAGIDGKNPEILAYLNRLMM